MNKEGDWWCRSCSKWIDALEVSWCPGTERSPQHDKHFGGCGEVVTVERDPDFYRFGEEVAAILKDMVRNASSITCVVEALSKMNASAKEHGIELDVLGIAKS